MHESKCWKPSKKFERYTETTNREKNIICNLLVISFNKNQPWNIKVPIVEETPNYAYPSLAFSVIVDRNHCSNLFSGWLQRAHFFFPPLSTSLFVKRAIRLACALVSVLIVLVHLKSWQTLECGKSQALGGLPLIHHQQIDPSQELHTITISTRHTITINLQRAPHQLVLKHV